MIFGFLPKNQSGWFRPGPNPSPEHEVQEIAFGHFLAKAGNMRELCLGTMIFGLLATSQYDWFRPRPDWSFLGPVRGISCFPALDFHVFTDSHVGAVDSHDGHISFLGRPLSPSLFCTVRANAFSSAASFQVRHMRAKP